MPARKLPPGTVLSNDSTCPLAVVVGTWDDDQIGTFLEEHHLDPPPSLVRAEWRSMTKEMVEGEMGYYDPYSAPYYHPDGDGKTIVIVIEYPEDT